jgi:hypothetical protein
MKYKMKGHELPGIKQRKDSPHKILSFMDHGSRTTKKNLDARVAEANEDRIALSKSKLAESSKTRGKDPIHVAKVDDDGPKLSDKIKNRKTGYMSTGLGKQADVA